MARNIEKLTTFPVFVRTTGRKVAVFGNGAEAVAKTRLVANSDADIVVYADDPSHELVALMNELAVVHDASAFEFEQLEGATLVFAATGDDALDRAIVLAARARNIPANAVDQPDYCDFYTPALVNRAPVAIAIGTEGAGPVLAQMIRSKIDTLFSPSLGPLARLAQSYRDRVDEALPRGAVRRAFWKSFFSGKPAQEIEAGNENRAREATDALLAEGARSSGHVALVGAGPGAEDRQLDDLGALLRREEARPFPRRIRGHEGVARADLGAHQRGKRVDAALGHQRPARHAQILDDGRPQRLEAQRRGVGVVLALGDRGGHRLRHRRVGGDMVGVLPHPDQLFVGKERVEIAVPDLGA